MTTHIQPSLSVFDWRRFSLKTQIGLATTLVLSVMLLAQALLLFSAARAELRASQSTQLEMLVSRVAEELDNKVSMRVEILEAMARHFPNEALSQVGAIEQHFRDSPSLPALFDDLYLFSPTGVLLVDWPVAQGRRGLDMVERDYIQGVIHKGETTISKPVLGRATKQPIIVIATPLRNTRGELAGILAGVVNLHKSRLLEPLFATRVGQSGYLYLIGPERLTIMHPDRTRLLKPITPIGVNPILDRALSENLAGTEENLSTGGSPTLLSFNRLRRTGWTLVASLPSGEALAPINKLRVNVTLLTAAALLLSIGVIVFIVRRFTRPLEMMTDFLKSSTTLEPPPPMARNCQETDRLAAAFAQFVALQKATLKELDNAIEETSAANANLRIAAIAFESQEGMFITNAQHVILRVNQAFTSITGYSAQDAIGQTPSMFSSGHHGHAFYATMYEQLRHHGSWQGEVWNRRKSGSVYPQWLTITAVLDGQGILTHFVSTLIDISQRKAAEDKIQTLAFYDPLTQLPNRRLLMDRLQQALASSTRSRCAGALLFLDLDNFKLLNDSLGHDHGDLLLQHVALRLTHAVRDGDTVARLGGDEFILVLNNLGNDLTEAATQAEVIGDKILSSLNLPYELNGHKHHNSPSIGITLFNDQSGRVDDLMKQADLAMYEAKNAGRNTLRFFDPNMQATVTARAALESDLRSGLQLNHFQLYYQSQVDSIGCITGVEALVRWQHPQRGLISPVFFIPLAEETGLIVSLGRWVLETACEQLATWSHDPTAAHLTIAVNVSARQLAQPDFVPQVLSILQKTGAAPSLLKLELTESLLQNNMEEIIVKMTSLKEIGIGFSLDDFGTGYSSLSYLKLLPLDQLKIDQSFVHDLLSDPNDAAIARTIVALAHSLGLTVIAEGVETEDQRNCLAAHGCHAYQGYLFGHPLPVTDFERLLHKL